jgi:isopentenyl diphosphate isomerase/L-lactate dehydrogenase-like FMN-dependent dehydrogenase
MKKFDFKDITLVPETLSTISSRSEINIKNKDNKLPIIVSPMDTIVDSENYDKFVKRGLEVCLPREVQNYDQSVFTSISLSDFESIVNFHKKTGVVHKRNDKVLIDIANGHMSKLYELCKYYIDEIKLDEDKLMIGNIANPTTYELFSNIGVDYIRVGIGGGSGCLTSANTGVHYPMASLISECYKIKKNRGFKTKIVADGGFRNYDDIIKALALGADYVMLGGVLNKTLESCSPSYLFKLIPLNSKSSNYVWNKIPFLRKYMYKKFRGMSTKEVQKKWGKDKLITSEGISKYNKVEYTLDKWIENLEDYMKSAMSYTNSKNLTEFKETEYVFITENALNRYNK